MVGSSMGPRGFAASRLLGLSLPQGLHRFRLLWPSAGTTARHFADASLGNLAMQFRCTDRQKLTVRLVNSSRSL